MKKIKKKDNFDFSEFCDTYIIMDDTDFEHPVMEFVKVNGEYKNKPDKVRMKLNKEKGVYEEDENQSF